MIWRDPFNHLTAAREKKMERIDFLIEWLTELRGLKAVFVWAGVATCVAIAFLGGLYLSTCVTGALFCAIGVHGFWNEFAQSIGGFFFVAFLVALFCERNL